MAELLKLFEDQIESIALIPADGGKFEVMAGDRLLFSKLSLGRHAEPGEVARLVVEARDREE
jgi:selenoprotein W-related protein